MESDMEINNVQTCRPTFNFSICSLFAVANVYHQETFGGLVETHDKIIEFSFYRGMAQSTKRINQTTLIVENVDPNLELVCAANVGFGEILKYRVGQLLRSGETTRGSLRDKLASKNGAVAVD